MFGKDKDDVHATQASGHKLLQLSLSKGDLYLPSQWLTFNLFGGKSFPTKHGGQRLTLNSTETAQEAAHIGWPPFR